MIMRKRPRRWNAAAPACQCENNGILRDSVNEFDSRVGYRARGEERTGALELTDDEPDDRELLEPLLTDR